MQPSEFRNKIISFSRLLEKTAIENISENIYCRKYLEHLLTNRAYYLRIYTHLFSKALNKTHKNISEISLVDFGCGNGLLGIFLKYCGAKKVVLLDTDPLFIDAAQQLSKQLGIAIDEFRCGDENMLLTLSMPDMILATDVIEHVYDVDALLRLIKTINPKMITAFTTASNPENKVKVKKLMALQVKDELEGGVTTEGELGHTPHRAFLEMRKHIIQNLQLNLSDTELENLASLTRGQRRDDIQKTMEYYIKNKIFPPPPDHPTNTCDPYTGNWTERILTISAFQNIYNKNGFYLNLYEGFYNQYSKGIKAQLAKGINLIIRLTGFRFAPYIVLVGSEKID